MMDQNQKKKVEHNQKPSEDNGDIITHSFGAGYATRSDEEGFGGTINPSETLKIVEKEENHPEFDKSQGSEVKEKEKGRHQPH
ncbi:uncharacterized protein LOC110008249 [Amborella trichopoda]|uniref:uncharacterized protein LOC110008249 n=1 Tax=Amborella trichopoda TaxID=13333 RepID=UPI0009BE74D1|nr:uncharacterized protein LOC110008249 [Amborella trichopoda]|eukprot:XP_020530323.1 uncharacterized protein LOC110008249 [Amborella trichopoda]